MGSTRSASKKPAGHQSTMHPDQAVDEEVDSEEDRELFPFRNPKLMTARQLSLKMQRSASAVKQGSGGRSRGLFDPELLTLESLEPPKPVNKPTPEQLLARQQRTARRRESAKRKVEMQKQQTVERLLKINANSVGLSKRGRGRRRGPMGRLGFHPFGSTCPMPSSTDLAGSDENDEDDGEDDDDRDDHDDEDEGDQSNGNSQRDTSETKRAESAELSARLMLAEQHSLSATMMDPHPGYIRWLSSSKLTPTNRVCVGPSSVVYPFSELSFTPVSVASRQLCALGCGRFKRYTCSTTGRPLCSLSCYKQSMANFSKVRSTEQSCA
ncbi:hypothetical protein FGIG_08021 [Fasciola gigantica]|uniref:INO80 complex subunit B-like conserved region domain-containing protein n=1 Tax=Fasciola gigantica TaxID=46835 RepID=A0A504YCG4_FASGI|nr:hypothetical protein FGIG_08021 [Fasciola gigantica]